MSAEVPRTRRPQILATRQLALAGIVGPPIFVAVFLVVGVIKPHYNAVDRMVSEGSIGELGWIQICNFLAGGAALAIFALGLWRGFGDRVSGRIGSALVGVAGVAMIGAGVFVADPLQSGVPPVTTHGALHDAMSVVTFTSLSLACFFFARRFWNALPFAIYLIVSGILIGVGISPIGQNGPWPGITQRVTLVIMLTWITILGLRLRKSSPGTSM